MTPDEFASLMLLIGFIFGVFVSIMLKDLP